MPTEKKYPKIEFKILPDNFEKALNSNDKTVSEAYKKWRKEAFPDWWTIGELEQEWCLNQPRTNSLEIFPEAREYLEYRLRKWKGYNETMKRVIRKRIDNTYSIKDKFSRWFRIRVIKTFDGDLLRRTEKEIKGIGFLLTPRAERKKNGITRMDIDRAREVPFDSLLQFNQGRFAVCPFHAEKKPSLYLYKTSNRIYCFGCGYSADTIKYIQDQYNLSFIEAVKKLN